ncbi:MAG TPA: farnesyl diphosphate synthase [Thermohalobaculum sp.]|nr:farnesyl diphosphate synthase [Thermohalobaculum sp.]
MTGAPGADAPDFAERLAATARRVEGVLDRLLPAGEGLAGERELATAMRHGVLAGGKRLRAFLAIEAAALFAPAAGDPYRVAAAMECLHAYSLIHDDLPAMDDDDLRRGQPTVHRKWDEATAILAGDALQALAFEILAAPETHSDGSVRARLCLRLAQASGAAGMVGGQAIDLAAERAGAAFGIDEIRRLQALKTGALIEVSAEAGAIVAGVGDARIRPVAAYARALGEAFQIADDLLDVTGSAAETGKRVGKDRAAGKATFVDILGEDGARARAGELVAEAEAALAPFGERAATLIEAARFTIRRRR